MFPASVISPTPISLNQAQVGEGLCTENLSLSLVSVLFLQERRKLEYYPLHIFMTVSNISFTRIFLHNNLALVLLFTSIQAARDQAEETLMSLLSTLPTHPIFLWEKSVSAARIL
jgi:hypothetical protein